jgi:ribosome maturation factor RimP
MTTDPTTLPDNQPASPVEPRFIREVGQAAAIAVVVEPRIEALGFRLVKVTVSGRNGTTVQIMAERPDGGITVRECEQISRDLAPALDVAEPLPGQYHLEISSPGIDRPLVRASDFVTWVGLEARIELTEAIDGRKRLRGRLDGFIDGEVRIELLDRTKDDGAKVPDGEPIVLGLPPALIANARLIMTDDLIREDLRRSSRNKHNEAAADDQDDGTEEEME